MSCVRHDKVKVETIVIPCVLAVLFCYAFWVLFAYWPRLRREWQNLRAEALKRRSVSSQRLRRLLHGLCLLSCHVHKQHRDILSFGDQEILHKGGCTVV